MERAVRRDGAPRLTTLLQRGALRLAGAAALVWAVASVLFVMVHLAPGDPAAALGGDFQSAASREADLARLGLDLSLAERYLSWLAALAQGDMGVSATWRRPVLAVILERLPVTLGLVLPALALSTAAGVALSLAAARRPGGALDRAAGAAVLLMFALPVYWLAHLLVFVFAIRLGWLPVQGMRDLRAGHEGLAAALDVARHMALPILTLACNQLATIWLVTRAGLLTEMASPHFRTARAKGLSLPAAQRGHALPQASLALATVVGARFAGLLTAATLVETVFGLPGIGRLLTAASLARDYPLILGVFLFAVVLTLAANAITDAYYALADPRIRDRS